LFVHSYLFFLARARFSSVISIPFSAKKVKIMRVYFQKFKGRVSVKEKFSENKTLD